MTTLSERVKLAMAEKSCSVTALAKACNIKPPSVSDWINGSTKTMKSATGRRAASFLGVNFLWLTEGMGKKFYEPGDKEFPSDSPLIPLKETMDQLANMLLRAGKERRAIVGTLLKELALNPEGSGQIPRILELLLEEVEEHAERSDQPIASTAKFIESRPTAKIKKNRKIKEPDKKHQEAA